MGNLLFLYFLHTITTRLAKKTQRYNPRYELTNPTKTPPPPFAFSLLSVILLHLHYTLQSPSPSVTTPRSFVTLSPHLLLLPPVLMLPCPLQLCYYSSVPLLLCLLLPCLPSLSCKECLPILSTGAFTLSKTRPFKHAEHALLAP